MVEDAVEEEETTPTAFPADDDCGKSRRGFVF